MLKTLLRQVLILYSFVERCYQQAVDKDDMAANNVLTHLFTISFFSSRDAFDFSCKKLITGNDDQNSNDNRRNLVHDILYNNSQRIW